MTISRSRALWLAARPRTLAAGLAPVAVGTAIAHAEGHVLRWDLAGLALCGAIAIQVGTNYFNDAFDFEKGADTGERLGPPRAAASGLLTPGTLKAAALASFAVAMACGIPLVMAGGLPILALGLLSLLFGWAYTGGPWPLAYHGLGEVFVLVFFGLGAVGGTYWLHAETVTVAAGIGGLQNGLFACALLTVNNLRDAERDATIGKRTLAARFDPEVGRTLLLLCAIAPFALHAYWAGRGAWAAAGLTLVALLPVAGALRIVLYEPPSGRYNIALARVAGGHLVFALLLALGLFLA
jgi:1,4-dihydroxy-2-naphthoate octaprenyltransferase